MAAKEETALDAARSRFVEGLPKKAAELRAALTLLVAAPASERGRDELRRRLHALHASAQVFRVDELAKIVGEGIALLDRLKRETRAIADDELDRLLAITAAVAELGGADSSAVDALLDDVRRPTLPGAGPSPVTGETRPGMQTVQNLDRDEDLAPTRPGTVPSVPPSRPSMVAPKPSATQVGNATEAAPRPRSNPPVSTVISVMLVGPLAARLAVLLPADRFEIVAAEAGGAMAAARAGAPDVIVVGDDIVVGNDSEFVRAIRGDASTDLVPLLLVSAKANLDRTSALGAGCDDVIATGIESRPLAQKIARLAGLLPSSREAELGTRTLREIADRMAEELRRGLVDSVERGADERLSLGDGTELFAAVWSAIARMRTTVVDRSGGRVRFRDTERRGGPALLSLGESPPTPTHKPLPSDVSIVGRRILVADDDPAVRWFFVGLLHDAGADVLEAPDGAAALELARQNTPDLVITDILMPKLDGLSLTRELHRDPVLAEVPVIFLSWKEDYLHRMRELRAGAAGYLLKEEGASTILDRVRDAFRPRIRFESRLRDGGDVRGRVEGLGVLSILRSVGRIRRDARVTVRDVHSLFEIDVRRGQIVELVRTGGDGSFARGGKALASLLGVSAGRFAVLAPTIGQKPGIEPIGPEMIEREARRLGALVDAVSGRGLALADRVDLDPLVVAPILAVSPPEIVDIVRKLESNPSPRRWLLSGEVAPEVLGGALIELARRGAVLSVRGEHGEDRVSESLALRLGVSASELDGGKTGTAISIPPEDAPDDAVEPLDEGRSEVTEALESIADADVADSAESTDADAGLTEVSDAEVSDVTDTPSEGVDESGEFSADDSLATVLDMDDDDAPAAARGAASKSTRPDVGANKPSVVIHSGATPKPRRREGGYDDTLKVRVDPRLPQHPEPDTPSRSSLLLGAVGVAIVIGLGYVVHSATKTPPRRSERTTTHAPTARNVPPRTPTPTPSAPAAPPLDPPVENAMLYGERVDPSTVGVPVPAGQGGIVVSGASGLTVHVDGRDLGAAPQGLAVSEGWHTVELRAGDDERVLFVPIRSGQARRITMP